VGAGTENRRFHTEDTESTENYRFFLRVLCVLRVKPNL